MKTTELIPDEHGVASMLLCAMIIYSRSQRTSGRTKVMIQQATDEDTIYAPNQDVARHIDQMVRDAGKKTKVMTIERGMRQAPTHGRVFFDHTVVEDFFMRELKYSSRSLAEMMKHLSPPDQSPTDYRDTIHNRRFAG